jgi:hypothetical protein
MSDRLHHLLKYLTDAEPMVAVFWFGLMLFTLGLAILMYTRWGQYKPLRKCMGLSLLVHLMLACYATTIHIAAPAPQPIEPAIGVHLGEFPTDNSPDANEMPSGGLATTTPTNERPWETFSGRVTPPPTETATLERAAIDPLFELKRSVYATETRLPGDAAVDHVAQAEVGPLEAKIAKAADQATSNNPATTIDAPTPKRREAGMPSALSGAVAEERMANDASDRPVRAATEGVPEALLDSSVSLSATSDAAYSSPSSVATAAIRVNPSPRIAGNAGSGLPSLSGTALASVARDPGGLPGAYRLRTLPNRVSLLQTRGGTPETEAAVKAAMKWLADHQSADGRWDPRVNGGGQQATVLGRDRQNAGSRADSAVTGLALLAFLASGQTHLEGDYREDVRRGLDFLIRTQAADGNLAGEAETFEFMYSHAMAACALSEAYGMTRDTRLREPVSRAVGYTLRAQDARGGGWRYRPGDAGDTSILGWQLMTLKSAELAGIPIPENTRQGIIRYLQSVATGAHGGQASYRPGEAVSRSMTAEALVCWQFLGVARNNPACDEAGDFVLGDLPNNESVSNFYYWYYGTLSMYQLQGTYWRQWNAALRDAVVRRQIKDGPQAGSWDTTDVWGPSGGRIYTTALAALTLEVYYRFLPLYVDAGPGK